MMKVKDSKEIMKYVNDYFIYGIDEGYFEEESQVRRLRKKIMDLDLIIHDYLPNGDAKIEDGTLEINRARTFTSEKNASLVLFHEFTHACSEIHKDMHDSNGVFERFYKYMEQDKVDKDVNNPKTYVKFGALFLDEVLAENAAEQLVARKFGIPRKNYRGEEKYGIRYITNTNYYSIGQDLVDRFAKTLFMQDDERNIHGLTADSFKEDFVKRLVKQHFENGTTKQALYDKLCYMGVISFAEEQSYGRLGDRKRVTPDLVRKVYTKLEILLNQGIENRENIPNNINVPFL